MARPTKLTPAVHESIVTSVRNGAHIETAAEAAGLNASTVWAWIRRADDDQLDVEPAFLEFSEAVKKARAEAELAAIRVILDAAPKSWQAAAWYLERSRPTRWRRAIEVETDTGAKPITLVGLAQLMGVEDD